jgi:hypothetical protein
MEYLEKKSGVNTRVVASSAIAFAPFSQYSPKVERSSSGSGQAQPGQSTPFFWLRLNITFEARIGFISFNK